MVLDALGRGLAPDPGMKGSLRLRVVPGWADLLLVATSRCVWDFRVDGSRASGELNGFLRAERLCDADARCRKSVRCRSATAGSEGVRLVE